MQRRANGADHSVNVRVMLAQVLPAEAEPVAVRIDRGNRAPWGAALSLTGPHGLATIGIGALAGQVTVMAPARSAFQANDEGTS